MEWVAVVVASNENNFVNGTGTIMEERALMAASGKETSQVSS
jgi:hypothetical protein